MIGPAAVPHTEIAFAICFTSCHANGRYDTGLAVPAVAFVAALS